MWAKAWWVFFVCDTARLGTLGAIFSLKFVVCGVAGALGTVAGFMLVELK